MHKLLEEFQKENISNLQEFELVKIKWLGKSGIIASHMRDLAKMTLEEKKSFGEEINKAKESILKSLDYIKSKIDEEELQASINSEWLDPSIPQKSIKGSLHPISETLHKICQIFSKLGFEVQKGPDIETDWYNFTALGFTDHHPARQMHDTFYMQSGNLLRTHTSPVQIRAMLSGKPPFAFIVPGRVYREDMDATHSPMFHQVECMYVNKDASIGGLKFVITEFLRSFFGDVNMRMRPSFFPFTTPSFEVDISWKGKWLEVMGCGMVHPDVLKNGKVDTSIYKGFALGMGVERLAMLKYGFNDLREFFNCDYRNDYGIDPIMSLL